MDPNEDNVVRFDETRDGIDLNELINIMGDRGRERVTMYVL